MCNFYRLSGNKNNRTCSTTWSKFIIGLDDLTVNNIVVVSVCPQNNSLAALGKYKSSGEKGAAAQESLFVADHSYWVWISLTHFLHIPLGHLTPLQPHPNGTDCSLHSLTYWSSSIVASLWIHEFKKNICTMPSILTCEVRVTVYHWTQCIVSLYLLLAHLNLRGEVEAPLFLVFNN